MIYFKVLALNTVFLLLFPVVLLQALWVRRKTAVLPEPDGKRVFTSAEDLTLPSTSLLVVGDSAAAGVGATSQEGALSGILYLRLAQYGPTRVSLHAKTGYKSEDVLNLLYDIPAEQFTFALVSIGVNDVTKFVSLKQWQKNVDAIGALLTEKFGCKRILFTALPPIHCFPALPQPLRTLLGCRAWLLNYVLAQRVAVRDNSEVLCVTALNFHGKVNDIKQSGLMAEDGFHPSTKGYEIWAHSALERLRSS